MSKQNQLNNKEEISIQDYAYIYYFLEQPLHVRERVYDSWKTYVKIQTMFKRIVKNEINK